MKIITVESNVDAGGGELLNLFKCSDDFIKKEPLYNWKYRSLLDDFFRNPERWTLTVALRSLFDKFNYLKPPDTMPTGSYAIANDSRAIILERSIYSDRCAFVKTLIDMNTITNTEQILYNDLFDFFIKKTPCISVIIYIKLNLQYYSDPHIVRGSKISKKFFELYEKNLENWLISQQADVITINVAKPLKLFTPLELNDLYEHIRGKLRNKLKSV